MEVRRKLRQLRVVWRANCLNGSRSRHRTRDPLCRTAIIGTGHQARMLAQNLEDTTKYGLDVLGFIALQPGRKSRRLPRPLLGTVSELPDIVTHQNVRRVLIAVDPRRVSQLPLIAHLHRQGVRVDRVAGFASRRLRGSLALPLVRPHVRRLRERTLVRKTVESALAIAVLATLAPALLLIALLLRLEDKGVLYRQPRVGKGEREFTFFKFRTMLDVETETGTELRVTPVGRFLRQWSLDELPQLFNVARGDMAFVGPRPLVPSEAACVPEWARCRFDVRPGITGVWQVSGRRHTPFNAMMELEMDYVLHRSLALDLATAAKTLPAVLRTEQTGAVPPPRQPSTNGSSAHVHKNGRSVGGRIARRERAHDGAHGGECFTCRGIGVVWCDVAQPCPRRTAEPWQRCRDGYVHASDGTTLERCWMCAGSGEIACRDCRGQGFVACRFCAALAEGERTPLGGTARTVWPRDVVAVAD